MPTDSQLTPRQAVIFGSICIACALTPILAGLRMISTWPTAGTPGWVAVCSGVVFLFAGLIFLSDAAAGGLGPNGLLLETAPAWVKPFQWVAGLAIVASSASVMSWVAFGSGERHFSSQMSLPFVTIRSSSGDTTGRWAFGIMAVAMWLMVAAILVRTARDALAKRRGKRAT